jgi:hypothetical protein
VSRPSPAAAKPAFLITIDTEGDDLWSRPQAIETLNSRFLARFQHLCEDFGFRPTWLVNHEMANCPTFQAFGKEVLRRGTGEIGMHLHAWNCPPVIPLTDDDHHHQPFLIEYPAEIIEAKIRHMTDLLHARFECAVVSHRAGRWALDATYAQLLSRYGYGVDCSVTPHVSWVQAMGAPNGHGGADYRNFPELPYWMDLDHIDRAGNSPLLELPVTVLPGPLQRKLPFAHSTPGLRRWAWRREPPLFWLYPDGTNLRHMLTLVDEAVKSRRPCIELVLHSSELMPGGSPLFGDEAAIEGLYSDLHLLFCSIAPRFVGRTLAEFRQSWRESAH